MSLRPLAVATGTFRSGLAQQGCFYSAAGATRGYAANLKALKRRRGTVGTVGKITATMKTVASSKMPLAQARADETSPFFTTMNEAFAAIAEPLATDKAIKVLTLVICTDKGLCGSTNNNLTRALLKTDLSQDTMVIWGDKGCGAFENSPFRDNVKWSAHPNPKGGLNFIEIGAVVDNLLHEEFDVLRIVFNRLARAGTPIIDTIYIPSYKTLTNEVSKEALVKYEMEATATEEMLQNLNEFHVSAAINYAAYQNMAVEMFNRRNAMDSASKNAKEIGQKLTILYNRVRQAAITTELCEITAGAAAVDEMDQKK